MKVPFSPPDMTEQEAKEVRDAILSGWITTGPRTKKLEQLISEYVHTEKTVCLNSATASMEMVLHLLGIGPGDEVIVPAYTYTATASVTQHVGAKLVMVDSQKDNVEMDYDQLEKAITERTKVIVPVDLGGIVADYDRVFEIVERKKHLFHPANALQAKIGRVIVSADCAHSFGAWRKGKMAGEIADFSSFSFHAVKNFTTAEGGAMTWNLPFGSETVSKDVDYMPTVPKKRGETWNELLYRLSQLFSLHGQNKDALAKTKLGAWEYDIIGPWYKCNMTDIMAAVGLVQFERYPNMLKRRQEMVARYNEAFAKLPVAVLNHKDDDHCSSHHLYLVRLLGKNREETNRVIEQMAQRGIATNVHYKPLPMMNAYKALGFDIKDYPNAYRLFENEITLPLHTKMTDEMLQYVIDNFIDIVSKKKVHLCLAHMSDTGEEMKYVNRAFDDRWVAPLGPNVDGFEDDLKRFIAGGDKSLQKKEVVALSSGTAAVHLGLVALGVGEGDEVLAQSFTFCASMNPIRYLGATPIIIDSDPDTWNMDPVLLEAAIKDRIEKTGKKPKAIVTVYLYGMPPKIDEIMTIAHKYDIPVLEDAAEAFGSQYKGRMAGTFGDYGVLSFNGNKMITTSGGGALICPNKEAKERVKWYAMQAREAYPYYQHESVGYNYRMSNVCAGIGRGQMTVAKDHIAHHRHIAEMYEEAFRDVKGISYHSEMRNEEGLMASNYWLSCIVLDEDLRMKNEELAYTKAVKKAVGGAPGVVHGGGPLHTECEPNRNVEALRIALQMENIESRPLWKPMHKQPVYKDAPAFVNGVSEGIFKRGLCLPSGPLVTDEDVQRIINIIKSNII